jgi:putative peptidoglycan lipid II flippase
MSENRHVVKAAGVVGVATLLSRIVGFVRDMIIAGVFGAGLGTDAFFVAFRMPNLLRRLFAEGSLTITFIPVFTECMTHQGQSEAFRMARSVLRALLIVLIFTAVTGVLITPWLIRGIAPGFYADPEKYALTVLLTRIMFPYVIFVCLVALSMGILNVMGHFAAPALAPVLLNLGMITGIYFLSPFFEQKVIGLAIGVLIGGVLQMALQIPFLIKKGFHFFQKTPWYHPGLKKIFILMGPAVFGSAVYQVNILVGTLLASLLPEGSVSYLYYADRLVQFPLGIFAVSMATAILPSLSRQAAAKDLNNFRETFVQGIKLIFFITIPAMIGLIVLREPIVRLLFQRGAFDSETTRLTASALLYYSIGLCAFSAVRIAVSSFYALSDTKTPVRMATVSIVANMILGILLMRFMAHAGLALATSLASMLNLGLLLTSLRKRLGKMTDTEILRSIGKSLMCGIAMGIVVQIMLRWLLPADNPTMLQLVTTIAGTISVGLFSYMGFSFILRSMELKMIFALARQRISR